MEPVSSQEPDHAAVVDEHILHLLLNAKLGKDVSNGTDEFLGHQIHTRHRVRVLQPQVMILVKIQVIIAVIVRERIHILIRRVDIGEFVAIEEVDLPHRSDDKPVRSRATDRLSTIVCQATSRIIDIKITRTHFCPRHRW